MTISNLDLAQFLAYRDVDPLREVQRERVGHVQDVARYLNVRGQFVLDPEFYNARNEFRVLVGQEVAMVGHTTPSFFSIKRQTTRRKEEPSAD